MCTQCGEYCWCEEPLEHHFIQEDDAELEYLTCPAHGVQQVSGDIDHPRIRAFLESVGLLDEFEEDIIL